MELDSLKPGTRVMICAADEFFAYVDGWTGTVIGVNSGLAVVECQREDGAKTFYVPAAQLRPVSAGGVLLA